MSFRRLIIPAIVVSIVSIAVTAVWSASLPSIISYQGKVLVSGSPASTTLPMSFEIYDSLSGGNLLYTASGTLPSVATINVTPTQGLFTVYLGDETTNSLDPDIFKNNEVLYLQVTIDGETLSPRKRITASPYALSSRDSKYLDGNFATSTPTTTRYIPVADTFGNFELNGVTSTNIYVAGNVTANNVSSSAFTLNNITINDWFSAGSGLNLNGTVFSLNTSTANVWSGLQTFDNAIINSGTVATSTISGLDVSNFATNTISQWVNDEGYITSSALSGYLTGETDPVWMSASSSFVRWDAPSTTYWNTAFSWGNHALVGYLTSFSELDPIWSAVSTSLSTSNFATNGISQWVNDEGYISSTNSGNTNDVLLMTAGGAQWVPTSSLGITGGSGTTYTAGSGLNLAINEFSLDTATSNNWTATQTFSSIILGGVERTTWPSGGALPIGVSGQFLVHDGSDWLATNSFTTNTYVTNILPSSHLTYTVGNSSSRFSEGWFENVYVGSSTWKIGQNSNGLLTFSDISTGSSSLSINSQGFVGFGIDQSLARIAIKDDSYVSYSTSSQMSWVTTTDPSLPLSYSWVYGNGNGLPGTIGRNARVYSFKNTANGPVFSENYISLGSNITTTPLTITINPPANLYITGWACEGGPPPTTWDARVYSYKDIGAERIFSEVLNSVDGPTLSPCGGDGAPNWSWTASSDQIDGYLVDLYALDFGGWAAYKYVSSSQTTFTGENSDYDGLIQYPPADPPIITPTSTLANDVLVRWNWDAVSGADGYLVNIFGDTSIMPGLDSWGFYATTTNIYFSEIESGGSFQMDGPPDVSQTSTYVEVGVNETPQDYGSDSFRLVYDTNNFSSFKVLDNGNLKLSVNQSPTGTITLSEQGTSLLGNVGIGMDLNNLARLSILDNSYSAYSSSTSFQNITVNNTQNIELTDWEDASVFLEGKIPPETGRNVRIYSYKDTVNGRIYSDPTYYVIPPNTTSTPAQDYMAIWSWDEVEGADGYLYNGYVQGMGWFLYSVTTNTVFSEFNSSPEFRTFGTPATLSVDQWVVTGAGHGLDAGTERNARVYSYRQGNDGTIIYSEPVYFLPLGETTTTPSDDTLISWIWDDVSDEDGYLLNIYADGLGWAYYATTSKDITTFNEFTGGSSFQNDGPPIIMPTSTSIEILNETPESFGSDSLRLVYDDNNFVSFKIRNNGLLNINTNGNSRGGIYVGDRGSVGIGTSTFDGVLTIDGVVSIYGAIIMDNGNLFLGNGNLFLDHSLLYLEGNPGSQGDILMIGESGYPIWTPTTSLGITGGGSGESLPGGSAGQILYHDGSGWIATNDIFVSSSGFVGIGTTSPLGIFHVSVEPIFGPSAPSSATTTIIYDNPPREEEESGDYWWNTNNGHALRIYSYKEIKGQKYYSSGYFQAPYVYDDNGISTTYSIFWEWDEVDDADGYLVLKADSVSHDYFHGSSTINNSFTEVDRWTTYREYFPNESPSPTSSLSPASIFVDITGNVGINTTTPNRNFVVQGDINITGSYLINGNPTSLPAGTDGQILYYNNHMGWIARNNLTISSTANSIYSLGNLSSGSHSFALGGTNNQTYGDYSFIGGGSSNHAYGELSFIGGGSANNASGDYSFIGGGSGNTALGDHSSIIGGGGNYITSTALSSAIIGGGSNTIGFKTSSSIYYSGIFGGNSNKNNGIRSIIVGGFINSITAGLDSVILGGAGNTASSSYSVVLGGYNNTTTGFASYALGRSMKVSGQYSFGINLFGTSTPQELSQNNTFAILNGSVGIGTTTPNSPLTVYGTTTINNGGLAFNNFAGDKGHVLMISSSTGLPYWTPTSSLGITAGTGFLPGGSAGQMLYYNGVDWAATNNIFVSSSGFVGIGTINPTGLFQVSIASTSPLSAPSWATGTIVYSENENHLAWPGEHETYEIRVYSYRLLGGVKYYSSSFATASVYTGDYLPIFSNFNINWSWGSVAGADGYLILKKDESYIFEDGHGTTTLTSSFTDFDGNEYVYLFENGEPIPGDNGTVGSNPLFVNNIGNVGINTTSPSHLLTVAGDINITGNYLVNGVALSAVESDPIWLSASSSYVRWDASSTTLWNEAYSWGDHSLVGYLTTSTGLTVSNFATSGILQWVNDAGYITSTGPVLPSGQEGQILVNNGTTNWVTSSLISINTTTGSISIRGVSYVWPAASGTVSTALINDGNGNLSWGAASTTAVPGAAGSSTHIQFNYNGALAGSNNFIWDHTNSRLGVGTTSLNERLTLAGNLNIVDGLLKFDNLPGTPGQILKVDVDGFQKWMDSNFIDTTSSPAGSDGEIQFNDSGNFGATSSFFWDKDNERLGIGTSTPGFKLTIDDDGGILALGKGNIVNDPQGELLSIEGIGTRMIWYPRKAAFRAGSIINPKDLLGEEGFEEIEFSTDQWDEGNIGGGSFAANLNNKAGGAGSAAFGFLNNAVGDFSFVSGIFNTSSGMGSFVGGMFNEVSGSSSVAFGTFNEVTGENSFAIGNGLVASGKNSLALGNGLLGQFFAGVSSGYGSVILGNYLHASATGSIAIGNYVSSTASGTIAIGNYSGAAAEGAVAIGYWSGAFGKTSYSFGNNVVSNAEKAFAFGNNIINSGTSSMLFGLLPSGVNNYTLPENTFAFMGGNVGIGTTTSDFPLSVDGAISIYDGTYLRNGKSIVHWDSLGNNIYSNNPGNVGVGTSTPLSKLHIDGGGLLVTGSTGATPTRLMWIPEKGAFRAGAITGDQWDDSNIGNYSAVFGYNNTASNTHSFIGGGSYNTVSANIAVIIGGRENEVSEGYSSVIGGFSNIVSGEKSSIVGGTFNKIATGTQSFIAGGGVNFVEGDYSAIIGGQGNSIFGGHAFIAGGKNNTSTGNYSFIGGGGKNILNSDLSFIGGGYENAILSSGNYSFVAGGQSNTVSNTHSFIAGGESNIIGGKYSFIGAGKNSKVNGNYSAAFGYDIEVNGTSSFGFSLDNIGGYTIEGGSIMAIMGGKVGIGTTTPSSTLAVVGSFEVFPSSSSSTLSGWVSPDDGSWVNSSDENLKKNIIDFTGSLEKVKMLRPVSYEFKNEKDAGGTTHIGLLAQEIEQIFPQVVSKNSSGLKGISYANLTPILVQAIQEQQEQIDALKNASTTLTVENTEGQIVYTVDMGQDMLGRPLLNVASVVGTENKWEIDTTGLLKNKISTSEGDKEIYGLTSENIEITLSGNAQLQNGEAVIVFATSTSEIIDDSQPMKVSITLTADEPIITFVKEKSARGFTVKQTGNGMSNATFDWIVIAKRKFVDPFVEEIINEEIITQTSFSEETPPQPSSSEVEGGEVEPVIETGDEDEEYIPSPLQGEGEGEVDNDETSPQSSPSQGEEETTPPEEPTVESPPSEPPSSSEEEAPAEPPSEPVVETAGTPEAPTE